MIRHTSFFLAFLAVTPALAGPREDVYSASLRCSALADDRNWLDCYYGAAQPMRDQLKLPAAPLSQTSLIPPANDASAARQQALHPVPQKQGPLGQAFGYLAGGTTVVSNAPITSYEAGKRGFTVVLTNGQVWKQSDEAVRTMRWRDRPQAHHATIWKGALNTFNLGFDGETDRYKVHRVE